MTLAVHNVVQLSDDEVRSRFVVRSAELADLVAHLREDGPPRHALVIGPRGMGKSLLLRRVALTVADDPDLADGWLVVTLPEELYEVTSVAELWLVALSTAATQLDDVELSAQHAALLSERDPVRLEALALQRLLAAARVRGRRLLLLAENLDMLLHDQVGGEEAWTLRQALQNENDLLLMASSVTSFAQVEESSEALYGFFHRVDLRPLGDHDVRAVWREVTGVDLDGERVVPIRVLTGGNPRLVAVLGSFSRKRDLTNLRADLELLIDEYTPFFKANVEALAPMERKVFVTLADIWAPATAAEVAERARMTSSQVSAQLARLQRRGAVEVVDDDGTAPGAGGRRRYELTERLYNLYHLLRRPDGKGRVTALVDILVHLYDPVALERDVWPGLVRSSGLFEIDLHVAGHLERHIDDAGVWDECRPDQARENLVRFESLLATQSAKLGPDHPDTLLSRHAVAFFVGKTGHAAGALELYREVVVDRERVLGPDHPDTLISRDDLAGTAGETGDAPGALELYRQVLVDRERVLGHDHLDTLRSRHQVAYYLGETGDVSGALELLRQVVVDRERVLGPDHPRTLTSRSGLAYYLGKTGDAPGALELYRKVAAGRERVLGHDHPDTLVSRDAVAYYLGQIGDAPGALQLYRQVVADQERVLGPDHPDTLSSRHHVAYYLRRTGDVQAALEIALDVVRRLDAIGGHDDLRRAARGLCDQLGVEMAVASERPLPRELRAIRDALRRQHIEE